MSKTSEEKRLLDKFFSGALDGIVGDIFTTSGGSSVWTIIKNGRITRYKQGPTTRFFNGEENERLPGVLHTLAEWVTEDQILEFFQKFGWLMSDNDASSYSAKFKPKK